MSKLSSFDAMDISASALNAQRQRMNIIAGNIANANSMVTSDGGPYRRREITFATAMHNAHAAAGEPTEQLAGVKVQRIFSNPKSVKTVYDPQHPLANKDGFVQTPDINVTQEMADMVNAQREYEANLSAMRAVREIGRTSVNLLKR